MKLQVKAFGLAGGIILGLAFGLMITVSLAVGRGETIGVLRLVLPFFTRSLYGVVYGVIGGFIEGFIVWGFFAWLYNRFYRGA
jgi:hypothetical protein